MFTRSSIWIRFNYSWEQFPTRWQSLLILCNANNSKHKYCIFLIENEASESDHLQLIKRKSIMKRKSCRSLLYSPNRIKKSLAFHPGRNRAVWDACPTWGEPWRPSTQGQGKECCLWSIVPTTEHHKTTVTNKPVLIIQKHIDKPKIISTAPTKAKLWEPVYSQM